MNQNFNNLSTREKMDIGRYLRLISLEYLPPKQLMEFNKLRHNAKNTIIRELESMRFDAMLRDAPWNASKQQIERMKNL